MLWGRSATCLLNRRERNRSTSAPTFFLLAASSMKQPLVANRSPVTQPSTRCTRSFTTRRRPSLISILRRHPNCSGSSASVWRRNQEKRYQTIRDTANDLEELLEEMKGVSDIERSVAPPSLSQHIELAVLAQQLMLRRAPSTASLSQHPSSAEFIAAGIGRHKLGVGLALAALVIAGALVGYYVYSRSSNTTITLDCCASFPNPKFRRRHRIPF